MNKRENRDTAAALCAAAGLGQLKAAPVPVPGGLLHRMYKLETSQGIYAVKRLNPHIAARPGVLGRFEWSERVAEAAFESGVRALPAIVLGGRRIAAMQGHYYMLYPWVDGVTACPGSINQARSEAIGRELAMLHGAALSGLTASEGGLSGESEAEQAAPAGNRQPIDWR